MEANARPTLSGARVLVIDDHRDLVSDLQEILEDEGAEVRHATTGAEALRLAADPFDVALLDVRLPDATGHSLLPRLRRVGAGAEVVLITGNGSLEDAIEAVSGGAYAYVLKPFEPTELLRHVERAVRQARSTREAENLRTALEEREAGLRTLVDTVQALLLVLDADGRIVQANQAVAAVTGRAVSDMLGQEWLEHFVPEEDRATAQDTFRRLIEGASTLSHENRVMGRDAAGQPVVRWVSWRSSALWDPNGELRLYASGLDTTDLRRLERRTRLAEKLAAVGTLSAGLAHEIRNPLNAASLQLRLLERRCRALTDDAGITEPLHVVQEELDRLSRLVREFLQFARPSELHPEAVDLRHLAASLVDLERPAAEERRTRLEAELPEAAVRITADREKVQQVVLNLVHNALDAAGAGGRVRVRVAPEVGGGARVSVLDDGPGIPLRDQSRIFEPFFSTKAGGTGLGMAIVHSLVSLHGGDVAVESGPGGTEVRIVLPGTPPLSGRDG